MADARQIAAEAVDAFNAHDADRIRALYADNVVYEAPGDARTEGPDDTTEYAMSWLRAFPDARVTVRSEAIDGDFVAQEFTFEGTHEATLVGAAGEIPATGRRISGRGAQFFRVADGKIVEESLYFDQVQLMTQLGLMPEAAEAHA